MQLVPVGVDSIRIGQPLPFPLMDKDGVLLARKAYVIASRADLVVISERGGGLYIDVADSEAHHRAYVEQLHDMVRSEKSLGEIAGAKIQTELVGERAPQADARVDWMNLQESSTNLLRDNQSPHFLDRLDRFHQQLNRLSRSNPDGTLFALIYLSATDARQYSATHSMLVSVMCGLAAREVLKWIAEEETLLCKAALTMNFGMTDLQDRLAVQLEAPTAAQRRAIKEHPQRSAEMLASAGVKDQRWLDVVRAHHTQTPGPLQARSLTDRLARLIQRADMFAARLAPRASRVPIVPAAAMQACYFDENREIDEAGAALIKAVGIYQPGSFVRLASNEVAVVVKRGQNTTTPRVAVLVNRSGLPTVEPTLRDSAQADYRIVASVPHREVKVKLNLERLLPLTALPNPDRPW
jgi:HD-GYP domain-containing protein (c-di-GMP phosphodiesterase class II)